MSVAESIEVLAVAPAVVRPLRKEVLRPGTPLQDMTWARDEEPGATHGAVMIDGEVVGVGSVMPDGHPDDPSPGDWRIRGMATRADVRGRGIGSAVLAFCERNAREQGATRLWCNARVGARTLYERGGLAVESDVFEIEGIGPHYVMGKRLD